MRDLARKLREDGLTFAEISEKLNIDVRKVRYWSEDIKLSKEQIAEKIRRIKILSAEKKYRQEHIEKETLQGLLLNNEFYKAIKLIGLTEGCVRYWCNQYNIEIKITHKARPLYKECSVCGKKYNYAHSKRKVCNTCVSKIRRKVSKIKAVNYLGGKCKECGYEIRDNNYAAFEFHHPDDNKESEIGTLLNRKWDVIEAELKKCSLLCSNCHRISHSDYRNTEFIQAVKEQYLKDNKIITPKISILDKGDATIAIYRGSNILIKDDELKNLVKTESVVKIANKFNVSPYVIIKICKAKNIKIVNKNYLLRRFIVNRDDLEDLVKAKPMRDIGKIFGVSDRSIRKRCDKMRIDWRVISPYSHSKKKSVAEDV